MFIFLPKGTQGLKSLCYNIIFFALANYFCIRSRDLFLSVLTLRMPTREMHIPGSFLIFFMNIAKDWNMLIKYLVSDNLLGKMGNFWQTKFNCSTGKMNFLFRIAVFSFLSFSCYSKIELQSHSRLSFERVSGVV